MEWSRNWMLYYLGRSLASLPYMLLIIVCILAVQDVVLRKLRRLTIVALILTLLLFIVKWRLQAGYWHVG